MRVSKNGLNLIKEFEGLRLDAYLCPANIPTIGYGCTQYLNGNKVKIGDRISASQAEALLDVLVNDFVRNIRQAVKVPLTQNQLDALVSFVFNIGIGAFKGSTLLRKLNAGDYASASIEILRWNKATVEGRRVVLVGLARRRVAERELFIKP